MHCTPLRYSVAMRPSIVIANRCSRLLNMRIVSLLASGTEIVCALGAGEMLVGRSHECDNPPWVRGLPCCTETEIDTKQTTRQIDTEVRRRLKAGEPLYRVDNEK